MPLTQVLVAEPCAEKRQYRGGNRAKPKTKIGRILVTWREAQGLTRADILRKVRIKISEAQLRRIETKKVSRADIPLLFEIARVLGMLPEEREVLVSLLNVREVRQVDPDYVSRVKRSAQRWAEHTRLPAFVADDMSDLLVVNRLMLRLLQKFGYSDLVDEWPKHYPYNLTLYLFSPKIDFARMVKDEEEWANILKQNLRFFRYVSLPYHDECYWHGLINMLLKHPDGYVGGRFYDAWLRLQREEQEYELPQRWPRFNRMYRYVLPNGQTITVSSMVTPEPTQYGMLYFSTYHPADAVTARFFAELAEEVERTGGPYVFTLAQWPLTNKLKDGRMPSEYLKPCRFPPLTNGG
ncbi:MAG: helix-turn-helix transcriptional regulator [Chloroflexi bacterium]|nr:helix-turn-helix transcriptional regulator [Chloroflexota bacterium]